MYDIFTDRSRYFNYNDPSFDPEHKLLFNSSFGWMGPYAYKNRSNSPVACGR
jgi:hypothetical protein